MELTTAVILAGGLATRMRPLTEKVPKALLPVAGRPFIEHQMHLLRRNGFTHLVLCLGFLGEQVQELVGDGSRYGLSVSYSFDGPVLQGTGGALRQARANSLLPAVFWVLYGDSYLDFDYPAVGNFFTSDIRSATLGLMTVFRNNNLWDSSNVIFKDGKLHHYDKFNRLPQMEYIDYGAAILRQAALDRLGSFTADAPPVDLASLYSGLVTDGLMVGYEVKQRFYEIGSRQGLDEINRYLAEAGSASQEV